MLVCFRAFHVQNSDPWPIKYDWNNCRYSVLHQEVTSYTAFGSILQGMNFDSKVAGLLSDKLVDKVLQMEQDDGNLMFNDVTLEEDGFRRDWSKHLLYATFEKAGKVINMNLIHVEMKVQFVRFHTYKTKKWYQIKKHEEWDWTIADKFPPDGRVKFQGALTAETKKAISNYMLSIAKAKIDTAQPGEILPTFRISDFVVEKKSIVAKGKTFSGVGKAIKEMGLGDKLLLIDEIQRTARQVPIGASRIITEKGGSYVTHFGIVAKISKSQIGELKLELVKASGEIHAIREHFWTSTILEWTAGIYSGDLELFKQTMIDLAKANTE